MQKYSLYISKSASLQLNHTDHVVLKSPSIIWTLKLFGLSKYYTYSIPYTCHSSMTVACVTGVVKFHFKSKLIIFVVRETRRQTIMWEI